MVYHSCFVIYYTKTRWMAAAWLGSLIQDMPWFEPGPTRLAHQRFTNWAIRKKASCFFINRCANEILSLFKFQNYGWSRLRIMNQNACKKMADIVNNRVHFHNLKLTRSQNAPVGPDFEYSTILCAFLFSHFSPLNFISPWNSCDSIFKKNLKWVLKLLLLSKLFMSRWSFQEILPMVMEW